MEKLILHGFYDNFKKSKFIAQFVEHLSKSYEVVCDNDLFSELYIGTPKIYNKKFWHNWLTNGGWSYTAITDNPNQALYWLFEDGFVIQRNKIDGKVVHTEVTKPEQLLEGTVYKRVYKDSQEYRVHVCKGSICAFYLKVPAKDGEVTSQYVKTLATGYKYTSKFPKISKVAIQHISRHITEQFAYTFFAIDFIYSNGKWLVADVIVNPAVSSKTLDRYVKAFVGTKPKKAVKEPIQHVPNLQAFTPYETSKAEVEKWLNMPIETFETEAAEKVHLENAASVYFDNYFADIPVKKSKTKVQAKPPKWGLNGANASKVDMSELGTTVNTPQVKPYENVTYTVSVDPLDTIIFDDLMTDTQTTQQDEQDNEPLPF